MYSKRDLLCAAFIFVATFTVFRLSPIYTVYDSRFEMMFSQQLLWHHSFSVDPRAVSEMPDLRKTQNLAPSGNNVPYQLVSVGERLYYVYPPGSVILSAPYVAVANAFGLSAIDANGLYNERGDLRIQRGLAPLLMAALSAIIFLTSRLIISLNWSLLIAAGTAFGTQVFSTGARAVWSQTWGILILAFAIWLIVKAETKGKLLPPLFLGTTLSWLYFVRPNFVISVLAISLFVLLYHRKILLPFLFTGCVWLGAFIGYSEYYFHRLVPFYFSGSVPPRPLDGSIWQALAIHLISPGRGLFVYVPVFAFVLYWWIRYSSNSKSPLGRLGQIAASVILIHLVLISFFVTYGGHCYGPRLSTDLVPWFAFLAMLAVQTRLRRRENQETRATGFIFRIESAVGAFLLLVSITINAEAGVSTKSWKWNAQPTNIDEDQARVWDWKHPQFAAAFQSRLAPPN